MISTAINTDCNESVYTYQTRPACKYEGVAYSVAAYIL